MTPFYHCKKTVLPNPKEGPPIHAVVTNAPTGGMVLTVPRGVEYPLRTPINATLFDPVLGVVLCRCMFSSSLVSGGERSYRCEVLESLAQKQRREDIKISLSARVEVVFDDTRYTSTIYNISASGVYIVSSLAAKQGDMLSFEFNRTDPPIPLTAQVLRVENRVDRRGQLIRGYGCRFVDLGVAQESQLRSYIFQEERRLYHSD